MTDRPSHTEQLLRLSAHLEELFSQVSECGGGRPLPQELADEIAATAGTAGDIMVELADHRNDELARGAIEDARQLREVLRTLYPEAARAAEAGRTLVRNLDLVIREDKRAA